MTADWAGVETATQFPVVQGTVVEVHCSDQGAANRGSSLVTCVSGTSYSFEREPDCTLRDKREDDAAVVTMKPLSSTSLQPTASSYRNFYTTGLSLNRLITVDQLIYHFTYHQK